MHVITMFSPKLPISAAIRFGKAPYWYMQLN